MFGCSSLREKVRQDGQHVVMSKPTLHMDRQALPRVLFDDGQHSERTAVMRPVRHEVVGPDVVLVLRPQTDAGSVVEP